MNNHDQQIPEADRIRAELEDQLLNQQLEEVLGGVTPDAETRTVAHAPAPVNGERSNGLLQPFKTAISALKPISLVALCLAIAVVIGSFFSRQQMSSQSLARNEHLVQAESEELDGMISSLEEASLRSREAAARREEAFSQRGVRTTDVKGVPVAARSDSSSPRFDTIDESDFDQLGTDFAKRGELARKNRGSGNSPVVSTAPAAQSTPSQVRLKFGKAVREADEKVVEYETLNPEAKKRWQIRVESGRQQGETNFDSNIQEGSTNGIRTFTDGEGRGPGNRGDNYAPIIENDFLSVIDSPLSTFSIDVDTASYSNMRRMLTQNNMLPPPDAVRIEELVNYFNYDYEPPAGEEPFSVNVDSAACPWRPESRLVRIALKGKEIPLEERPASNLVFLLDVSGSMGDANKLPLLKSCFKMLVDYLTENDTISIVVYASGTRQVLPPTTGDQKAVIMEALDMLQAGGSTNGAGGIQLAYETATRNFIPGGLNRVILATDGDFNVGITSQGDLHRLIEEKAKSNVFLTTLGFGYGNLQDNTIELLADKGNGNYAYIDSLAEGRKVLIDEMGSTLNTIAKDVKIQIEFNPLEVAAFRLIGYENRILAHRDFNDDTKDAGEIGAGHTVTAFYELIPAQEAQQVEKEVDALEFQRPKKPTKLAKSGDMMLVKLRYKFPDEDTSNLIKVAVKDSGKEFTEASRDFQFAASVASFGMLLRNSKYAGQANFKNVLEQAQATLGDNPESYRAEFVELVKLADRLAGQGTGRENPRRASGF